VGDSNALSACCRPLFVVASSHRGLASLQKEEEEEAKVLAEFEESFGVTADNGGSDVKRQNERQGPSARIGASFGASQRCYSALWASLLVRNFTGSQEGHLPGMW
jgi:hypothetical protein